jgi:hypothetical protein
VLRSKICSLEQEVAGLVWSEGHAAEASGLPIDDLFARMLASPNDAATEGYLTLFDQV